MNSNRYSVGDLAVFKHDPQIGPSKQIPDGSIIEIILVWDDKEYRIAFDNRTLLVEECELEAMFST